MHAPNSCNLISSRVWPDDGRQYAITKCYKNKDKYAFLPYTVSNLVRRELAGDFADDSSYVVGISNFDEGSPGSGMYFVEARGGWVFGSLAGGRERSALLLPLAEEGGATAPAQAQSDTLSWQAAEGVHKMVGKRGTFTHRCAQHLRSFVQTKTLPKEYIHSVKKYSHQMQFFLVFPKKTPSIE